MRFRNIKLRMLEAPDGQRWLHSNALATLQVVRSTPLAVDLDELGIRSEGFTVADLKALLQTLEGITPADTAIVYKGTTLSDERTLDECGITKDSWLEMFITVTKGADNHMAIVDQLQKGSPELSKPTAEQLCAHFPDYLQRRQQLASGRWGGLRKETLEFKRAKRLARATAKQLSEEVQDLAGQSIARSSATSPSHDGVRGVLSSLYPGSPGPRSRYRGDVRQHSRGAALQLRTAEIIAVGTPRKAWDPDEEDKPVSRAPSRTPSFKW